MSGLRRLSEHTLNTLFLEVVKVGIASLSFGLVDLQILSDWMLREVLVIHVQKNLSHTTLLNF